MDSNQKGDLMAVTLEFLATDTDEFSVVATPGDYGVDYVCYLCTAMSVPGMVPHYLKADWGSTLDLTLDIREAEWFLRASIRGDGFASLEFNQDDGVLRFLEPEFFDKIAALVKRLIEFTKTLTESQERAKLSRSIKCLP